LTDILTIDEAALRLRINRKTLYSAISAGQVPGVIRFGRIVRIHWPSFVEQYRDREPKGATDERKERHRGQAV
jgi:excisionase family DNA binding protein